MNSVAQRARNKRKRDKLRAKRQAARLSAGTIYRFKLEGEAFRFKYQCGLMPREYSHDLCTKVRKQGKTFTEHTTVSWETDWVYCSTHDLSSSALDAIQAFNNTWHDNWFWTTNTIVLVFQWNGQERRKVWQGHTYAAGSAARAVFSFARPLFSEGSQPIPSTVSQ